MPMQPVRGTARAVVRKASAGVHCASRCLEQAALGESLYSAGRGGAGDSGSALARFPAHSIAPSSTDSFPAPS